MASLTGADFNDRALSRSGTWLVEFTAKWCPPCRQLEPVLAMLGESYAGRIRIGAVDVDEQSELSARFQVQSAPTLFLFRDGRIVDRRVGATSKAILSSWIDAGLA